MRWQSLVVSAGLEIERLRNLGSTPYAVARRLSLIVAKQFTRRGDPAEQKTWKKYHSALEWYDRPSA